jgi:hypothetical protein
LNPPHKIASREKKARLECKSSALKQGNRFMNMSQVIDLCEGYSDDDSNGEWPNIASVPLLPLSRKRPWDNKEGSSNDAHPRDENGPEDKTATGSAEVVFDLELGDEVEAVSPHQKRRGDVKSDRSIEDENDVAGKRAQILEEVPATDRNVGSEDTHLVTHLADHRESHKGNAAAAATAVSHPMNLVLKQVQTMVRLQTSFYGSYWPQKCRHKRRGRKGDSPPGKPV